MVPTARRYFPLNMLFLTAPISFDEHTSNISSDSLPPSTDAAGTLLKPKMRSRSHVPYLNHSQSDNVSNVD